MERRDPSRGRKNSTNRSQPKRKISNHSTKLFQNLKRRFTGPQENIDNIESKNRNKSMLRHAMKHQYNELNLFR